MPDVTAGYGKLSDLNAFVWETFKYFYIFEYYIIHVLHQTSTNYALKQKCRGDKQIFLIIIYSYLSLVLKIII